MFKKIMLSGFILSSISISLYAGEFQYGAPLTANQLLVQRSYHRGEITKSDFDEQMKRLVKQEKDEKYLIALEEFREKKRNMQR